MVKPISLTSEKIQTLVFLLWQAYGHGFWIVELWKRTTLPATPFCSRFCCHHWLCQGFWYTQGCLGCPCCVLGTPRGGPFPESGYSVLQVRRAASKDSNSVTCKSMSHELRMKRWIKGPNSCKTPALMPHKKCELDFISARPGSKIASWRLAFRAGYDSFILTVATCHGLP